MAATRRCPECSSPEVSRVAPRADPGLREFLARLGLKISRDSRLALPNDPDSECGACGRRFKARPLQCGACGSEALARIVYRAPTRRWEPEPGIVERSRLFVGRHSDALQNWRDFMSAEFCRSVFGPRADDLFDRWAWLVRTSSVVVRDYEWGANRPTSSCMECGVGFRPRIARCPACGSDKVMFPRADDMCGCCGPERGDRAPHRRELYCDECDHHFMA